MTRHAYLGRDPSGEIVEIIADTHDMTLADGVRDMLISGLTIERVPVDWVRTRLFTHDRYWVPADAIPDEAAFAVERRGECG